MEIENDTPPSQRFGPVVLIEEIVSGDVQPGAYIRILGKCTSNKKPISIEHNGSVLKVDTSSLRDIEFKTNSLYQFIGELVRQKNELVLRARVGRNVDGIDVPLYEKALEIRRNFERNLAAQDI
eukprot:TRINITY_DN1481_c0_g1_i1.p1 TRINITY_DN1481_c0_g1~~TRINITY_DN1481_c0_g1_i1.p1  ORF type:complete len:124 (-),score=23.30 TRINITY_DN1481_c0_g1_i1:409-780(-)